MPVRVWRKITGPRLVDATAIAAREQERRRADEERQCSNDIDSALGDSLECGETAEIVPGRVESKSAYPSCVLHFRKVVELKEIGKLSGGSWCR